jgi:hypothetical protein
MKKTGRATKIAMALIFNFFYRLKRRRLRVLELMGGSEGGISDGEISDEGVVCLAFS